MLIRLTVPNLCYHNNALVFTPFKFTRDLNLPIYATSIEQELVQHVDLILRSQSFVHVLFHSRCKSEIPC